MRWAVLLLAACEPREGQPGYTECVVGSCDGLLICYEVTGDRGEARYWVEGPDGYIWQCDGSDCTGAVLDAEADVCSLG